MKPCSLVVALFRQPRIASARHAAAILALAGVFSVGSASAQSVIVTEGVSSGGLQLFTFTVDPGPLVNAYGSIDTTDGGAGIFANSPGSFSQTDLLPLPGSLANAGSNDSGLLFPLDSEGAIDDSFGFLELTDSDSVIQGVIAGTTGSNAVSAGPFPYAQVAILEGQDPSGTFSINLVEIFDGVPVVISTLSGSFGSVVTVPGDFDSDGDVDQEDFTLWSSTLGSTTALAADGSGNGVVDAADYTVWREAFEASATSVVQAPEPSALIALVTLAPIAFNRAKRRVR